MDDIIVMPPFVVTESRVAAPSLVPLVVTAVVLAYLLSS